MVTSLTPVKSFQEESVDDIADYIHAYGKTTCQVLFVAYIIPAIAACVEGVKLFKAYDSSHRKILYIDSLQLDIMVHSSLALSFFILLKSIQIGYYGESRSRLTYCANIIMCFVFVVIVGLLIVGMMYVLIDSAISKEDVYITTASPSCLRDFNAMAMSLIIIVVIRAKNRTFVSQLLEKYGYQICFGYVLSWYSYFFDDIQFSRDSRRTFPSYGSMNDRDSTSRETDDSRRSQHYNSHAESRKSSIFASSARMSSSVGAGSRVSGGRRSLSRTSDLAYMIGTKVLAKWGADDVNDSKTASWYPATIAYVYKNCEGRMYDIVYYDGEIERKKPHEDVHEYDEDLDAIDYNIIGKSRHMKLLMLVWLCLLYSYSCLKLIAFCFNAIMKEYDYITHYELYVTCYHQVMIILTMPVIGTGIYLWSMTARHFYIIVTKECNCGSDEMRHLELVVQTIECVTKIPLQPKRSKDKPVKIIRV